MDVLPDQAPVAAPRTLDFGRALMFVKGDPRWIAKLAIGSLVALRGLLLIDLPLMPGYYVRMIRRSAYGCLWHTLGQTFWLSDARSGLLPRG